ncbi:hypothetical protein SASPL_134722 [Salvia splendens]|uniref:Amino acid transporter transmembrane domain-containing protein n=1 Tax=Salvia splendens TaxID=180675 RepID=A0A8X8WYU7_SALSN|nr:hypothetical protein SASPL_134722 [Salvia splendens]
MGGVRPTAAEVNDDIHLAVAGEKAVDAGAQFVLKSRGSWIHCGYHLSTSIVALTLLGLPFAFGSLGWTAGILCLLIGAMVTFDGISAPAVGAGQGGGVLVY